MSDSLNPTPTSGTNSASSAMSIAPPDDTDVVHYDGSPKLRGELGTLALWSLLGFLAMALPLLLWSNNWFSSLWPVVIGVLVGLLCWIIPSLLVRRNYYRITNYRIDYEHGLIFKRLDTLELWHVDDLSLAQGPLDRIFNVGTITVVSNDATTPRLELRSLHNPRQLLETLKARIIAVKRQRGVLKMDLG